MKHNTRNIDDEAEEARSNIENNIFDAATENTAKRNKNLHQPKT